MIVIKCIAKAFVLQRKSICFATQKLCFYNMKVMILECKTIDFEY